MIRTLMTSAVVPLSLWLNGCTMESDSTASVPLVPTVVSSAESGPVSIEVATQSLEAESGEPIELIVTLEAHPQNFIALQRNVAAYPNVRPLHAALWSTVTRIRVTKGNRHGREWDFQVQEVGNQSDANTTLPAVTVDEVIARGSYSALLLVSIEH